VDKKRNNATRQVLKFDIGSDISIWMGPVQHPLPTRSSYRKP